MRSSRPPPCAAGAENERIPDHRVMNARERKALEYFYAIGVGEAPRGAGEGSKALENLHVRKWIERAEGIRDFGAVRWRITQLGREAYLADIPNSN